VKAKVNAVNADLGGIIGVNVTFLSVVVFLNKQLLWIIAKVTRVY
jgi:hypothetical protein